MNENHDNIGARKTNAIADPLGFRSAAAYLATALTTPESQIMHPGVINGRIVRVR